MRSGSGKWGNELVRSFHENPEVSFALGDSGIYSFDPVTGDKKIIADPEAEKRPDNRFNDGKCDPDGRFWAGTISTVKKTGDANLYMLDASSELTLKIPSVTNSNGICWNVDATKMYYIDTPTKEVRSYPFDSSSGSLGEAQVIVNTEEQGWEGSPDGMTIDSEGMIWVAMCHGGAVLRIDPSNGSLLRKVDFPCVETTACTFGEIFWDRLLVTTGIISPSRRKMRGRYLWSMDLGLGG